MGAGPGKKVLGWVRRLFSVLNQTRSKSETPLPKEPRVHLGSLVYVSKKERKLPSESWGKTGDIGVEPPVREAVKGYLRLTESDEGVSPRNESSWVLDLFVIANPRGFFGVLAAQPFFLPLALRPSVEILARVRKDEGKEVFGSWRRISKPSWLYFFSKLFSWRALWKIGPTLESHEMEILLFQACLKLKPQLERLPRRTPKARAS